MNEKHFSNKTLFCRIFIFIFFGWNSFFSAQEDQFWYVFYNSDSSKIGYKDSQGTIKINLKYRPEMISEKRFRDIASVWEYTENDFNGAMYYINKKGKKFGRDSVFVFDFRMAKESEGYIQFQDKKTEKLGFFDQNGKVVISALYDDAADFHNGISIVLKDAKKERWRNHEDTQDSGCDHWSWVGGKTLAINKAGLELFEIPNPRNEEYSLDYSRVLLNEKVDPEIYTTYQGIDGNTYSFISPERDFIQWFSTIFLPDFKKYNTVSPHYFYNLISVDDNDRMDQITAWKNHQKEEYMKNHLELVNDIFRKLITQEYERRVSWETLSHHSYFPENALPIEDISKNTVISLTCTTLDDFSMKNNFQFTKIGKSYYITSAPSGNE